MTINPALILILGAIPIPLLRGPFRASYLLILPLIGLGFAFSLEPGLHWSVNIMNYDLELLRIDRLSQVFSYIFFFAAGIIISISSRPKPGSHTRLPPSRPLRGRPPLH